MTEDKSKRPSLMTRFRRAAFQGLHELTRTGRITHLLWDAAQIQGYQRKLLENVGKIALELNQKGEISHPELDKALAKLDQANRLVGRQEKIIHSYQDRKDVQKAIEDDLKENEDHLAPV